MALGSSGAVVRDIQMLFDAGTASGLSDRQLLERFAGGRDAVAESAFEVLVMRHGPMVLRVCRNVLGDSTDAQDAFQATFLVLVKRSGSIRRLESVGSWLYGVACRVAARAKVEAARRRAAERRGGLRVVQVVDPTAANEADQAEFGPIIQEEVRRLPGKYRVVVALCYWQGLTQEQAATQLGCPLGTVRSRLAQARSRLHTRLTRRGLAPLAGAVAAALDDSASAAVTAVASRLSRVPTELVRSTVRAAAHVAAGQAPAQAASGTIAALVAKTLWNRSAIQVGKLMTALCFAGLVVFGISRWEQPPKERPERTRAQKVAQAKEKRPAERKFGPAPVVEPPDLLQLEVLVALPGRPISGERLVRPDGTISLGFYGDVYVAGLTLPEVKERIVLHLRRFLSDEVLGLLEQDMESGEVKTDKFGKPMMLDPKDTDRVFVELTAYNSSNYYVEGDVVLPGKLPYTGNETVLDVIHYAGGLLPTADRSKLRLIRSYPRGSRVKVLPIDYDEVVMGTDSSTNYHILPNDRLVVPRKEDDRSPSSEFPRRSAPSASRRQKGTSPGATQSNSFQALERQLKDVGKKLDRLIEKMKSPKDARQSKGERNAAP